MKLSLILAFLLLIHFSCQNPQHVLLPGNAPLSELQDEAAIERELVFKELKKQNSAGLVSLCKNIGELVQHHHYRYGRWKGERDKSPVSFEGVLPYINSSQRFRVEGNIIQHIDGHCELKLLEEGEMAVLYGRNVIYNNLVVVVIDGLYWDDISLDVTNLDDSQEGVYHGDPLIYQKRLEAIASRIVERDSILDNAFSDLVNYKDEEKQTRALGWLLSELDAAAKYKWPSYGYEYPTDLQKELYKYQYVKINNRLASLMAGSDSLFYSLMEKPGMSRANVLKLLGYLHPRTRKLHDGWDWSVDSVHTSMDITSIKKEIFRVVLESGDHEGALVVLSDPGSDITGIEPLLFQYLYTKGRARKIVVTELNRMKEHSDLLLDSLKGDSENRGNRYPLDHEVLQLHADRAALILIKNLFGSRRQILLGERGEVLALHDALLTVLVYSDSSKASEAVAKYYKAYCEVDTRTSWDWPFGGPVVEATGNRQLLLEKLTSENECHQELGLRYLNQIDPEYTAPIVLDIISDERLPYSVRRNLLVKITAYTDQLEYQYKYLDQHLSFPLFWAEQLEENGTFADLAIWRIGHTNNQEFIPTVLHYIDQGYPVTLEDKRGAAYALTALGAKEAGPYTVQVMQATDDDLARARMFNTLIKYEFSDSTIAPDLWPYLKHERFRGYAMNVLGRTKHAGSVNKIAPYLLDKGGGVHRGAALALCRIGTAEANTLLEKTLDKISAKQLEDVQKMLVKCEEESK